jgi:HAD superfamily hydrolase (TIGR01459 family)
MHDPHAACPPPAAPIPLIAGLGELAPRYDGLILDLWGVLHDGFRPFPGVVDCLERLNRAEKRLVVLSNAPRRAADAIARLAEIGIPRALYHELMTSGEEAWQHLARRDDPFYAALGRNCLHIHSPRDEGMLDGLGLRRVEDPGEADFILNTGPWGWEETVEAYEPMLRAALARDLPMVCANPDLVVVHGERPVICAGALAQRYEEWGGRVRWHGKPFPSVYETCFRLLGLANRGRVLAVGDSLRTDIAGANRAGIDSLLIAGGIHAEEFGLAEGEIPDPALLQATVARSPARPSFAAARFLW